MTSARKAQCHRPMMVEHAGCGAVVVVAEAENQCLRNVMP
jgi:hypothetical protein